MNGQKTGRLITEHELDKFKQCITHSMVCMHYHRHLGQCCQQVVETPAKAKLCSRSQSQAGVGAEGGGGGGGGCRRQCTCSPASDGSHLGDVHDSLVRPHVSQAAKVGVLEGLLGVGQGPAALTLRPRAVLFQQARQVFTLLPGHL